VDELGSVDEVEDMLARVELVSVEKPLMDVVDVLVLMALPSVVVLDVLEVDALLDVVVGGLLDVVVEALLEVEVEALPLVVVEALLFVVVEALLDEVIMVVGTIVELAVVELATVGLVVDMANLLLDVVTATTTALSEVAVPVPAANGLMGRMPGKKLAGMVGIGIETM
jgi:hypothetical protein